MDGGIVLSLPAQATDELLGISLFISCRRRLKKEQFSISFSHGTLDGDDDAVLFFQLQSFIFHKRC